MSKPVQTDYKPQMAPAPLSDEQRHEQWKNKAAKVAGDFFEGPAKRFLEEWDPKKPNELPDHAALVSFAHSLQSAMAEYMQACR
jgi:hypothetical protein